MTLLHRAAVGAALLTLLTLWPTVAAATDPAAAESQYRVARRLLAEGSPLARTELQKVLDLDPAGALADDALLEQALLDGIARAPEQVGELRAEVASAALSRLSRVIEELPGADRLHEARYYRGLLRLEPLPGYDPAAARLDFLAVATNDAATRWSAPARYAMAWVAERQGRLEAALRGYQRLVVDRPGGGATPAARLGLARVHLLLRDFGAAADWAQQAIDDGIDPVAPAEALRELAVRVLLGQPALVAPGAAPREWVVPVPVKSLVGLAVTADGEVLVADRKTGRITSLDDAGRVTGGWDLADPQALAVAPDGRIYAAAGEGLFRLPRAAQPLRLAALGDFTPVSDLAVDGAGRIALLDRRGSRLGHVDPGQEQPVVVVDEREARYAAVEWDGRSWIGLDLRDRSLVRFDAPEHRESLEPGRPVTLVTDLAGRSAVLDGRTGTLEIRAADLRPIGRIDLGAAGIEKPQAVAFGPGGKLHVLDAADGTLTRFP